MTDASKSPPIGATGRTVVRNVEDLRQARHLSLRALSERLTALGRPILPAVLHRLGQGKRRVDADDLMALALALGVNPNALLLPRDAGLDAEVELAPEVRHRAWAAWAWADGRLPLPAGEAGAGSPGERFAREVDFARHARPVLSAHDQAEALFEVYELADRIEAWRGAAGDPVIQGALRDRVIRQARQVMLTLEEDLQDDDAVAQLREAGRRLPPPEVG